MKILPDKTAKDTGNFPCELCALRASVRCADEKKRLNLPDCIEEHCYFFDDDPIINTYSDTDQDRFLDIETDACGNCFSDADPGL
jgi:hypothetical protein